MNKVCGCGNEAASPLEELSCRKCGELCCPSCAFALDSATYCVQCAESVLNAEAVRPSLSAPAAWILPRSAGAFPSGRVLGDKVQWIILVGKAQPDLFAHLVRAFARDNKVAIITDRRKDYTRNPPGMEGRLRIHGAAVVKRQGR